MGERETERQKKREIESFTVPNVELNPVNTIWSIGRAIREDTNGRQQETTHSAQLLPWEGLDKRQDCDHRRLFDSRTQKSHIKSVHRRSRARKPSARDPKPQINSVMQRHPIISHSGCFKEGMTSLRKHGDFPLSVFDIAFKLSRVHLQPTVACC